MVRIHEEREVLFLYLLTDLMIVYLAMTTATLSRFNTLYQIDFTLLQRDRALCLAIFLIAAVMAGIYRSATIFDRFDSIYYTLIAVLAAGVAQLTLSGLIPAEMREISRRELILGVIIAGIWLPVWHYCAARIVGRFSSLGRFYYLLGDQAEGTRIATEISKNRRLAAQAEYVSLDKLKEIVARHRELRGEHAHATEDVIITPTVQDRAQFDKILEYCAQHCRRIYMYPTLHDTLMFHHSNLLAISGIPLIPVGGRRITTTYLYFKRLIDVCVSAFGLLAAAPIFIATAVAIKATCGGRIFYLQQRQGKNGRPFRIIKFRSMEEVETAGADYVRSDKNDVRVTPIGAIIRKYKIDELPQLVNVLKGDMSLIGPRPLWEGFSEQNGAPCPMWERRLAVRPGCTGLAHVLGSSFSKPADFLRYDLVYISSVSFLVDLKILVATVRIVLSGKGGQ
ncbi:MAG: exopolysaccharide biosynthesis polyprenyl glycosylphosphotransferase [Nitrospiraceae bacterium]|nr:exopolysaccharide biosynthesis polyprenyl glycosylphosphotransferase [Nitrospiraceae bacterium]